MLYTKLTELPCFRVQAGDDKKLLQAASRKKKLEERHGLDKNAFGRKFKVSCRMLVLARARAFNSVRWLA